jgi:hypothetical protein
MATLDSTQDLPQYRLTLKYHSSRPPTTQLADKIGESLDLARHISALAYSRLTDALNQGVDAQGTSAAAKYHFLVDNNSLQDQRDAVINVMHRTEAALNAQV